LSVLYTREKLFSLQILALGNTFPDVVRLSKHAIYGFDGICTAETVKVLSKSGKKD